MSKDISQILDGWKYDANCISARWIRGLDGHRKVQLRLDLGLFQMEVDGRPDGAKPHGHVSLLDYYLAEEQHHEGTLPKDLNFEQCAGLQQEAMQYYYRYLAFYALQYLEGVVRDTEHNLNLLELVSEYADDDDVAWQFMQFYPYVRMMHARARAELCMQDQNYDDAASMLLEALDDLRAFFSENYEEGEDEAESPEVEILTNLLEEVRRKKPKSRADVLQEELVHAVAVENYEKAARLRDELKTLRIPEKRGEPSRRDDK